MRRQVPVGKSIRRHGAWKRTDVKFSFSEMKGGGGGGWVGEVRYRYSYPY